MTTTEIVATPEMVREIQTLGRQAEVAGKLLAALERVKGALEYVHETADVRDSIRNDSEHLEFAAAAIAAAQAAGIKAE